MSYSILYDKQFVKVGNGFIPFILGGDSNVFDLYNNKRSRSTYPITRIDKKVIQNKKDFDSYLKDQYEYYKNAYYKDSSNKEFEENFGYAAAFRFYGSHGCTWSQFRNIFYVGMKKALTIEEITKVLPHSYLNFRSLYEKENTPCFYMTATTTEKIIEVVDQIKEYEERTNNTIYCSLEINENDFIRLRKHYFPVVRKKKNLIEGKTYYAIHIVGYGYLTKRTRGNLRYVNNVNVAKSFSSKKHADTYIDKLTNSGYEKLKFKIVDYVKQ